MIRKRSSHMPMTTVDEAIAVPVIVRSLLMARIGHGMMKLQTTMVQNSGAKCLRMRLPEHGHLRRRRCRTRS